ncbi:MAG: response regulator [Elusimicrobia bacterium]|nr:response regulator [Elusimicrobiota bacterium]
MIENSVRVLAIEDDPDYVELIRLCLDESDGMGLTFELESASRLSEGLTKLLAFSYDAVLVDLGLPDARGLEAARSVLRAAPDTPVLVSTNLGDEKAALEAMRLGAQDFMIKASSDSRLLKRSIRYAIERKGVLAQRDQIIRAAVDGMVVVDASGVVRFVNAAAEAVLDAPAQGLLGRPFPHRAQVGESALLSVPREGRPPAVIDMRVTEVSWNGAPAALASLRDVTDLRRVEQLKAEVVQRRKLDELKDQWIDTLAHDLRTPLTIIKCAIVDLSDDGDPPLSGEQAALVDMARRQVERVERMTSKILEHSRLRSGVATLAPEPLDAPALISAVVSDFQRAAADRALALDADCAKGLPALHADRELFEQLLVNLVDNALRFARSRVMVSATATEDGSFSLAVRDDGVGIPPEKSDMIFARFHQLGRERGTDGYKGTGLGLSICKQIADMHRGRITAKSRPGEGTTFEVRLPLAGPVAASPGPSDPGACADPGGAR